MENNATINYEVKWPQHIETVTANYYTAKDNGCVQFYLKVQEAGKVLDVMFLETMTAPLYIKALSVNNQPNPQKKPVKK